ncbi:MAG: hypothetical protein JSV32_06570 [Dehalococcoidia bacterium]|nr:MAG: hypothetical protein JSV32_06570 [Dehalococcoidia bacterium]
MMSINKKLATGLLLVGIVSIILGGFFIAQGVSKGNMILDAMASEGITYGGAEGEGVIIDVIDTIPEAQAMAGILKEHRTHNYGNYAQLSREDPAREQILKAMTMENSLNLAQLGHGLSQVVMGTGAFMVLIGLTFGVVGAAGIFSRRQS